MIYNYVRSYDKSAFAIFTCQGSEPSEKDLIKFENIVGFKLPSEFREFTLSPLGGLYMEVREELWQRPKPFEVGAFWSFLYGIKVFGMGKDIPEWLDIREQFDSYNKENFVDFVPFLQLVGNADCYGFNSKGQIVEWNHEEEPSERTLIELSFSELVMREISELENRKERKLKEKGEIG